MSSLQNSLALVGGLTLVGVVLYNFWTARQNAPRQADPDSSSQDPGLQIREPDPSAGPKDPSFLDDALDVLDDAAAAVDGNIDIVGVEHFNSVRLRRRKSMKSSSSLPLFSPGL